MSLELRELYQEVIIDHNKNPRNHYPLEDATSQVDGFNPLCGDKLRVYARLSPDFGTIIDLSFVGNGCAISQASASVMTETLKGKTVDEAKVIFHQFHQLLTKDHYVQDFHPTDRLQVFAGVKAFPARVKCATLAWHTMNALLNRENTVVKTE